MGPHVRVHGRGKDQGGARGQQHRPEHVARKAVRGPGKEIRTRRGNHHGIRRLGQVQVRHPSPFPFLPKRGVHRPMGQGGQGQGRQKTRAVLRENGVNFPTLLGHRAGQIRSPVGGNRSGHSQHHPQTPFLSHGSDSASG